MEYRTLRGLALFAAVVAGLDFLSQFFRSIQFYWSQFPQDRAVASMTVVTFTQFSGFAYILFLVAIYRHKSCYGALGTATDIPLQRISKLFVVLWTLLLIGIVAVAIYWVFEYLAFQRLATQSGREMPSLRSNLLERARTFLQQALLLVPPYIIHRSLRANRLGDVP